MSHKVKVQLGGAADATVHDFSEQVLIYDKEGQPAIHGGGQVDDGSASVGEFVLYDDVQAIEIPYGTTAVTTGALQLASRNPFWWIEDSPGYDSWLSAGWIDLKDIGRFGHPVADERVFRASWQDMNAELRGIPLLTDEARPAESDVDRVQWVIDTFYSGDPRPSTVIETHLIGTGTDSASILMPAKTYEAGSMAADILDDCRETAGKILGVVRHDLSSATHKCLLYIGSQDYDTYTTDAKISDELADWDPTDATAPVFEPHWLQEAAVSEDPTNMVSGIVSRWSGGVVSYVNDTLRDIYNYFVDSYSDDQSTDATQATLRATSMTVSRSPEHITHMPSVLISPSQHPLLREGMSIQIKSRAAMGGQYAGTYRTRRIAKVNYEPAGSWNGEPIMWAHLELDRPEWRVPARSASGKPTIPQPPSGSCTDVTATLAPHFIDGTTTGWHVGGNTSGFSTTGGGHGGTNTAGTASGLDINCFLAYEFTGTFIAGKVYTLAYWYASNFSNSMPYAFGTGIDFVFAGPPDTPTDGVTGSVTLVGDTTWRFHQIEWTPSANRTSVVVRWGGVSGATGLFKVSDGSLEDCSGASAPPASDDGTGDPGDTTSNCFSPCDHKHPAQTAAVTPFTPDGSIAATNVQDAIVEVRDESASLSDDTPLVESGSGDAGTATAASRSDHVHPADGGGGGGGSSGVQYLLDVPPTSAHAKDDEFDGSSLDGKWTNPATTARTNTITVGNGWLTLEPSDSGTGDTGTHGSNAIRQAAPSGDFTISAKLVDGRPFAGDDDGRVGIFVARTANSTAHIACHTYNGGSQPQFPMYTGISSYSESVDWGSYDGTQTTSGRDWARSVYWVRIRWVSASGTLFFDYTEDGFSWQNYANRTGLSQPDRIGLALWGNSANMRADHKLFCDWFRVTEP